MFDKRVSTSCNSLKDLQQAATNSIKVNLGKDDVINLSSDEDDDSLLYKEAEKMYTKLSINHEHEAVSGSYSVTTSGIHFEGY